MKKLLFILLLVVPSLVFAAPQTAAKRNDAATTTLQNTNLGDIPIACNNKGAVFVDSAVPINVTSNAGTTGGTTPYLNLDLGNTGVSVKGSAGNLFGRDVHNATAATIYFKIYDKATAPSSADTPVGVFAIPAGSSANVAFTPGVNFTLGIGARCVTGVTNANTTSPAANGCVVTLYYK